MKNVINILSVVVLLLSMSACNDLLSDTEPSVAISQGQSLSSPGGVKAIRTSMYDRLHSFTYTTQYMLGPDALMDNLVNRNGATRFGGYVENNEGSDMSNWGTSYDLINDANLLINGVEEGVLDEATLNQYRGEARMLRAFAYHQLVRAFGYEPGLTPNSGPGAGFQLGVILRTLPTLGVEDANFRPRKMVNVIYDQITSDLNQSISLLAENGTDDPTFVTQAAAEALMARVQLYARNYGQADQFATDALSHSSLFAHLAQPDEVATMFDETTGLNPEGIFVVTVDPATESLGVNNSLAAYTSQQYVALIPTQDLMDLYGNDDPRLALYGPCFDEIDGGVFEPGCLATHPSIPLSDDASGLELDKWQAERDLFADNIPFFRVSEMLLIQAEARLNTGGDAATPLNKLRVARNEDPVGSVTLQEILDERRREFAGEGQRFFDRKRLGMGIRKAPETINTVIDNHPYSYYRMLARLPIAQVALSEANAQADSVLVQNPGY